MPSMSNSSTFESWRSSFCWIAFRPTAENHIAGEQAFVLPPLAVGLNRILRGRAARFFEERCLRSHWLCRLGFQRLPRFHGPKTLLIVAQPIRVRSNRGGLQLCRTSGRLRLTSDKDDHQN